VAPHADRIELVEEQDDRSPAPRHEEELVHVALGDSDVHVEDVGDGDVEEGGPHLPGDGAGDEGLAAPGRSVHEQAAAQGLAERLSQLRMAQGAEELQLDGALGLGHPADVVERERARLDVPDLLGRRGHVPDGRERGGLAIEIRFRALPVESPRRRSSRSRGGGRGGVRRCRACRVAGPRQQRERAGMRGLIGQDQRAVLHGLTGVPRLEEQVGEVEPQGGIIGAHRHGAPERIDHRVIHPPPPRLESLKS
jgi:hypothetical protein